MTKHKMSSEKIILRALQLFKERGYHATSMADIGKACGLLKGSIYHHFTSKEVLALAVMEHVHSYFSDNVFCHAYSEKLAPESRLRRFIKASEVYFFGSKGGCLMGNLALETVDVLPQFGAIIQRYFDEWARALMHIFQEKFSTKKAQKMARQAVADAQGAIMMMRIYHTNDYVLQANKRLLNLISD